MIDFALCHEGQWRDGELPKINGATYIVSQDTRHHAYKIQKDDFDEFLDWVAATFSRDNDPMFGVDFDGQIHEYFDEISVSVREA